ncbi:MAG: hypothetical protein ACXVB0_01290 [Mucilaginibacter sp.]
MKTLLTLLLGVVLLASACIPKGVGPDIAAIKGTWELRATRGGNIIPATYTPGNGHILSFADTTFKEYAGGATIAQGSYKRSTDGYLYTINTVMNSTSAIIGNTPFYLSEIVIQKDTLKLIPGNPDVATGYFVKTSNTP